MRTEFEFPEAEPWFYGRRNQRDRPINNHLLKPDEQRVHTGMPARIQDAATHGIRMFKGPDRSTERHPATSSGASSAGMAPQDHRHRMGASRRAVDHARESLQHLTGTSTSRRHRFVREDMETEFRREEGEPERLPPFEQPPEMSRPESHLQPVAGRPESAEVRARVETNAILQAVEDAPPTREDLREQVGASATSNRHACPPQEIEVSLVCEDVRARVGESAAFARQCQAGLREIVHGSSLVRTFVAGSAMSRVQTGLPEAAGVDVQTEVRRVTEELRGPAMGDLQHAVHASSMTPEVKAALRAVIRSMEAGDAGGQPQAGESSGSAQGGDGQANAGRQRSDTVVIDDSEDEGKSD